MFDLVDCDLYVDPLRSCGYGYFGGAFGMWPCVEALVVSLVYNTVSWILGPASCKN